MQKTVQTFQNQNPNDNCLALNDGNAETEELDKEIDSLHEAKENLRGKIKALKELVNMEIKDIAKETQIFEEEIKKDILYSQVYTHLCVIILLAISFWRKVMPYAEIGASL